MRRPNSTTQLPAWLSRTACNRARHRLDARRRRRLRELDSTLRDPDLTVDASDRHCEAQDRLQRFCDAVRSLPATYRDALIARMIERKSLEEAATVLATPVSTVSYRARRAEVLVRRALGIRTAADTEH